jgi:hypothetical protein
MMKLLALLAVFFFVGSQSHLCLLSPYQRMGDIGSMALNTPGSAACALTTMPPCGGPDNGMSELTAFWGTEKVYVVMQKNLDHFNAAMPGNFTVNFIHHNGTIEYLGGSPDSKMPSLSLYTAAITIPDVGRHSNINHTHTLQAIYYTNNAKAPAAFYQCANVYVNFEAQE